MINELYELSKALSDANLQLQSWHRKYIPIPNIKPNSPCIRILISNGKVIDLSYVNEQLGSILRKYGTNQGSYPCMNLAPLYRITDEGVKKELSLLMMYPERINDESLNQIRKWCFEKNWSRKFQNKYKISMINTVNELQASAPHYEPLKILMNDSQPFSNSEILFNELERTIWEMLERRENTVLALQMLFHQGHADKSSDDDYGRISVAFESQTLIKSYTPAISEKFVTQLNLSLLKTDELLDVQRKVDAIDAFGFPFATLEEPMPNVKLAGGFDVTLRTMFREQHCQSRYGKIENASYPISAKMRKTLQASLSWIGDKDRKNITWINIAKNEILFVYPTFIPERNTSFVQMFQCPSGSTVTFEKQAKQFIQELKNIKDTKTDSRANQIHIFILRKIDHARTKVVYTRQTNPNELETYSEFWSLGCKNLPNFPFGIPKTLYPLDVPNILNCFWKQNGEPATDKFKPIPKYHGLELLMDSNLPVTSDLHMISEKALILAPHIGNLCAHSDLNHPQLEKYKELLALTGLLLYRKGIRKDDYMNNLPYLYGQLLKAADELHAYYCKVMRKGNYPPQLVGSSLFQSAAESPLRTLNLLSQRIIPYYAWAKSYRLKDDEYSRYVGWIYNICENIMVKLQENWSPQTRFHDEEKAQLFIGYLSAFPKKEKNNTNSEEEIENE